MLLPTGQPAQRGGTAFKLPLVTAAVTAALRGLAGREEHA